MSILRKKSHWTLDVFYLHMDGLFSIRIKVSYNAEIFLMRYRLIHDWLLILTLLWFWLFFHEVIEQYGKLTSFLCVCPVAVDKLRHKLSQCYDEM